MRTDLRPQVVAVRLSALRAMSDLESLEDGRIKMAPQQRVETFEQAVARRLSELRALCDLTLRLQRANRRDA